MLLARSLFLTLLSLILISCATTSGSSEKSSDEPFKVFLFADKDINEDIYGVPSPTRITILQLSNVIEFQQMNEISVENNTYKEHLGSSVLEEVSVTVKPGEFIDFNVPLHNETRYIGIIAAFQDADNEWKLALAKQKPKLMQRNTNFLYINLRGSDIKLLSREEAVLMVATRKSKEKGLDINDLDDFDKNIVLKATEKALFKTKKTDVSTGLFSLATDKASDNIKLPIDSIKEFVQKPLNDVTEPDLEIVIPLVTNLDLETDTLSEIFLSDPNEIDIEQIEELERQRLMNIAQESLIESNTKDKVQEIASKVDQEEKSLEELLDEINKHVRTGDLIPKDLVLDPSVLEIHETRIATPEPIKQPTD